MNASTTILAPNAYGDPSQHALERSHLAKNWLYMCTTDALASTGSVCARMLNGYPLLAVNDGGAIRGFHNVCRHRAGPLVDDGTSTCSRFVCRYHGWAYDLDGALRNARDFGGDVHLEDFSLHRAAIGIWRGLVFIQADPTGPSLEAWIGPLDEAATSFPIETFVLDHEASHSISCNWKVYAENYLEGYHIPLVHPGLNRQVDAKRYEVRVGDGWCEHRAPTGDGAVTAGAWLWRFPGFALNLYPHGMSIEQFIPDGPLRTIVDYHFFFFNGAAQAEKDSSIASSTVILDEDRAICERVQRNLAAGIYRQGIFSPRHEGAVERFQQLISAFSDSDATTPG